LFIKKPLSRGIGWLAGILSTFSIGKKLLDTPLPEGERILKNLN